MAQLANEAPAWRTRTVTLLRTRRAALAALGTAAAGALAWPLVRTARRAEPPLTPEERLRRGQALFREQQYVEAMREFGALIRARPNAPEGYLYRGMAAYQAGQYEASITDLTRALELRPENAVPYLYRGDSYQALGKLDAAAADYQQALSRTGQDERLAVAARAKLWMLRGKR